MRQILLFLSPLLVSGLVSAQGAPLPDRDAQRREQIRDVLKSGRTGNTPGPMPSNSPVLLAQPPHYQLSPQGKAELREQLRREQNDYRGPRP
jgi:hypothetical protein